MDCVMVDKGPVAHKPPSSSGCQSSPLLSQGSPTKQNRSAIKYGELIILGYVKIYHIYTCTRYLPNLLALWLRLYNIYFCFFLFLRNKITLKEIFPFYSYLQCFDTRIFVNVEKKLFDLWSWIWKINNISDIVYQMYIMLRCKIC